MKETIKSMKSQLKPPENTLAELEQRISAEKPRKVIKFPRYLWAAAACLVIAVTAGGVLPSLIGGTAPATGTGNTEIATYPATSGITSTAASTSNELALVKRWEDMELFEQFGGVRYNDAEYSTSGRTVDAALLGEALGSAVSNGYDIYEDKSYTIAVELRAITGFDADAAFAVRYEGDDRWWSFTNAWYAPRTLGDFASALSLADTLGTPGYSNYTYCDDSGWYTFTYDFTLRSALLGLISDCASAETLLDAERNSYYNNGLLSIGVTLDLLDASTVNNITVSEDGYLYTNLLWTAKTWFIGEEKARAFIASVRESCTELTHEADLFSQPVSTESEMTSQGFDPAQTVQTSVSAPSIP